MFGTSQYSIYTNCKIKYLISYHFNNILISIAFQTKCWSNHNAWPSSVHVEENYFPNLNLNLFCFRIIPKIFYEFLPKRVCHICYSTNIASVSRVQAWKGSIWSQPVNTIVPTKGNTAVTGVLLILPTSVSVVILCRVYC